jgi:anaerobic carbon-monoxide dehydrogenase iron sulfur subunit
MKATKLETKPTGSSDSQNRMRLIWDPEKCVGCRVCEAVCSFIKEKESNPVKSRCRIIRSVKDNILYKVRVHCQQCEDAYCKAVCPAGAIIEDINGVKSIDEEKCIGCRMCEIACPVGAITVNPDKHVAIKCDLCKGLDEPQCVKFCYAEALQYIDAEKAGAYMARAKSEKMMELHQKGGAACQ